MSEPKTIREVLERRWPLVPHDPVVRDAWRDAWGRMKDSGVLDFHIIPGADAVVTAAGLEDAGQAACDAFNEACDDESGEMTGQEAWLLATRAAIEAAGIEVASEVFESPHSLVIQDTPVARGSRIFLEGEKVYVIKRAVTGHCDKEE